MEKYYRLRVEKGTDFFKLFFLRKIEYHSLKPLLLGHITDYLTSVGNIVI